MNKIPEDSNSLNEIFRTVNVSAKKNIWRRFLAFAGPAYLVAVGYMDPGNWATDIEGGSKFGYSLLWVLLMSNLMALLLQSLSARLGIVRGLDLAQASRATYSRGVNFILYILAEIAIAACDLAEVLGMAIGLKLLTGIPLFWGVAITVSDTLLLLLLLNFGIRKIEAIIISLIFIIGASFLIQMLIAQPDLTQVAKGLIPSIPSDAALYIAIGIIGATVMPHNLYLHSSLVQSRKFGNSTLETKQAIRYNFFDSLIALNLAFFVNAAILILAATAFFGNGIFTINRIEDAHNMLQPLLGSSLAPILFAVALIAAGQSSTITGTLAGQIIMEGYLNLRIAPWIRRLITRLLAIIPALLAIYYFGEQATGELLVLSQVILSLQLGFAIIPLIHFTSDKAKMGEHVIKPWMKILAWISALIIISLNYKMLIGVIGSWFEDDSNMFWKMFAAIVAASSFLLLIYIALKPFFRKKNLKAMIEFHGNKILELEPQKPFKRIAVAVDFSKHDSLAVNTALQLAKSDSKIMLFHIVETAGAHILGDSIKDKESKEDKAQLLSYQEQILSKQIECEFKLGFGIPRKTLPKLVTEFDADILIMSAHGHSGFKDLIFGATINTVRHKLKIPVFVVRNKVSE